MSRSKKYEKNLSNIQSMLDGEFKRKLQVGYSKPEERRKVGDKWTDSDGDQWEQKEGYISKVSKMASVGIFKHQCKDCKKGCIKSFDKETHIRMGRCYHCQIKFEAKLQTIKIGRNGNKWQFWVKLNELRKWDDMMSETDLWAIEMKEEEKNLWDMSVANALANSELGLTLKKNS